MALWLTYSLVRLATSGHHHQQSEEKQQPHVRNVTRLSAIERRIFTHPIINSYGQLTQIPPHNSYGDSTGQRAYAVKYSSDRRQFKFEIWMRPMDRMWKLFATHLRSVVGGAKAVKRWRILRHTGVNEPHDRRSRLESSAGDPVREQLQRSNRRTLNRKARIACI